MNIEAEALEALHGAENAVGSLFRRHHETPAAPAAAAVTIRATTGGPVSIAQLDDTVKADLTKGLDWMEGFVGRVKAAAPGILANAEKYENSPIVQALEGAFLPPAVEQQIANMITELKRAFPASTDTAPASTGADSGSVPSFTPAGPVVAGQA